MNELVQMGIDLYYGKTDKFSSEETNDAFRKALIDLCGGKVDYKSIRANKANVFGLIEETIDIIVPRTLEGQFDQFCEFRNPNWGDQVVFDVTDISLFKVAVIANGTTNVRAQRLDRGTLTIPTTMKYVKIYEEFYRFVSGRINWVEMVNRIALSFALKIKTDIYNAIYGAYASLNATYQASGAFSVASFNALVAHVQSASNTQDVICFGTKLALSKIVASAGFVSYNMMDAINTVGYLGEFQGTKLVELQQAHLAGTNTFAISDNFLLIIPTNSEKIVKVVFEGESIMTENALDQNADLSIENGFGKMYGIGVLSSSQFGIFQVS